MVTEGEDLIQLIAFHPLREGPLAIGFEFDAPVSGANVHYNACWFAPGLNPMRDDISE
jgi:hypothetical protein